MKPDLPHLVKQFRWMAFPAIVGAVAVVMALKVFAADGVLAKLKAGWAGVEKSKANVARLAERVEVLGKVGESEADEDLNKLLLIMPATKQVLPIISGLRVAAEKSGVKLEGYSAVGGGIKGGESEQSLRVDVNVAGGWPAVIQFVEETERQLPMRRVVEATYTAGKARVVVEGVWAPLAKDFDVGSRDIPDYKGSLSKALAAVAGYQTEAEASGSGTDGGVEVNGLF